MQEPERDSKSWLHSLSAHPIFHLDDPSKSNVTSVSRKLCFRGPDIIVAVGSELRIATFAQEANITAQYKTLDTPSVRFEIQQVSLAPGGKMLAIAGIHQVAVVVLPRPSYHKLVNARIDCKSIQVGAYYHAASGSCDISKVDWHPWSEGGTSLLVLTADAVLREYDISCDTEEPQQSISFVPPVLSGQFTDEDPSAREAVSFCFGKGIADWSPLTVYALMRNGDAFAICPFLPSSASIPASYIPSLEFFVAAKRELIERGMSSLIPSHHQSSISTSNNPRSMVPIAVEEEVALINDQQLKYVNALTKQLASSQGSGSKPTARVNVRPPARTVYPITRQGPFLLQPAPHELAGTGEEPDASDIIYIEVGDALEPSNGESDGDDDVREKLGLIAIVYRNGRVDLCLDTEKIEGRWDFTPASVQVNAPLDLPTLTVYESIDIGLIGAGIPESLLLKNIPSFVQDPLYQGRFCVSHSFGVHIIDVRAWMRALFRAMQDESSSRVIDGIKQAGNSEVTHLINTFDPELKTTSPIIALSMVDNGFVGYALVAVTSEYQAIPYPLNLRPDLASSFSRPQTLPPSPKPPILAPLQSSSETPPAYISLLSAKPLGPLAFSAAAGPSSSSSSTASTVALLRVSGTSKSPITPAALRVFGNQIESLRTQMRAATADVNAVQARIELQTREMRRQLLKAAELQEFVDKSSIGTDEKDGALKKRVKGVVEAQQLVVKRLDYVLQRLMDSYAPSLSEYEHTWFGELSRMKRDVGDAPGADNGSIGDGRSLWARTELLKHQLGVLRPQLEEIEKKQAELRKRPRRSQFGGTGPVPGLGSVQLRSVQRRLAQESKILEDAKAQAEQLTKWLEDRHASLDF